MGNNKIICVVICFFVGVLVYYLLKESCGCKVVIEGQGTGTGTGKPFGTGTGDAGPDFEPEEVRNDPGVYGINRCTATFGDSNYYYKVSASSCLAKYPNDPLNKSLYGTGRCFGAEVDKLVTDKTSPLYTMGINAGYFLDPLPEWEGDTAFPQYNCKTPIYNYLMDNICDVAFIDGDETIPHPWLPETTFYELWMMAFMHVTGIDDGMWIMDWIASLQTKCLAVCDPDIPDDMIVYTITPPPTPRQKDPNTGCKPLGDGAAGS